jgi:hypothetical protein
MNTRLQDAPRPIPDTQRRTIEDALTSEIRVPMAALRAALENLARQDESGAGRARVLAAAANEVGRLSSKVCSLIDAALASPASTLDCSIAEVSERLRRALDREALNRTTIACEKTWAAVSIDVAPFVGALAGLIESFTMDGASVLVRLSYIDGLDVRIIAQCEGRELGRDQEWLQSLRLAFAEHELEEQGVRIHWRTTQAGAVRVALRLDERDAFGGAA